MSRTFPKNKFLVPKFGKVWPKFLTFGNGLSFFSEGFQWGKKIFRPFFMLLLVEGEEKECLPKFGVLIFILAHEIKQFYSVSWKYSKLVLLVYAAKG